MSPSPAAAAAGANDSTQKLATTPTTTAGSAIEFEPPLACVRRILKNTLPNSTNVGKDASAAFCRACGIFVIYLTACANDFARENKRQTITANDVLAAVKVRCVSFIFIADVIAWIMRSLYHRFEINTQLTYCF